jgi:TonB family protein
MFPTKLDLINNCKKRIIMMKKNQQKPLEGFKFLVLPLFLVILLILYSFKLDPRSSTSEVSRFSKEKIVVQSNIILQDASKQDTVYSRVDENPHFTGGASAFGSFLSKNLNYPVKCKEEGIEGNVFIMVTIEKNGSVSNPRILKYADPLLENEALRIIKILPKFVPGKLKGTIVRVDVVVPINFKL